MPSAMFAIVCHILLYSRSGSALRIAEVDDHRSGACNKDYKCGEKCCKKNSKLEVLAAAKNKALKDCMEHGSIGSPFMIFASKVCSAYEKDECIDVPKSGTCANTHDKLTEVYEPLTKLVSAKKDPHVVNMAGEKFDILATGAFSLLSLTRATEEDLMINATIARFGAKCGESFITDLEHTGGWIRKAYNTEALKVRAVQDTAQKQALQINFGQKWEPLSELHEMAHVSKTGHAVQLDFSSVTVQVSAGKHWRHGWNFLNLDVQGLASLDDSMRVGGLLGYDDHTQVLQADADCAMFAATDVQDQQACLSYLNAN